MFKLYHVLNSQGGDVEDVDTVDGASIPRPTTWNPCFFCQPVKKIHGDKLRPTSRKKVWRSYAGFSCWKDAHLLGFYLCPPSNWVLVDVGRKKTHWNSDPPFRKRFSVLSVPCMMHIEAYGSQALENPETHLEHVFKQLKLETSCRFCFLYSTSLIWREKNQQLPQQKTYEQLNTLPKT